MGEKSVITSRTLNAQQTKRNASDFVFGKLIGEGSYSVVYLAKDIHTGKEYAGSSTGDEATDRDEEMQTELAAARRVVGKDSTQEQQQWEADTRRSSSKRPPMSGSSSDRGRCPARGRQQE
ncbi:uncharacterized protein LOC129750660 isoform X2 [Uranotaenia lowii]|uniref:uncharacterized protein LOC129750660 isoform X2 n=1 Tax=Uranotaenia lowii TaxID=190385 RepID=UPI002478F772|nr:uncharacterized protein LOC129750660 isoform X2 [Uranotaenia lowii]